MGISVQGKIYFTKGTIYVKARGEKDGLRAESVRRLCGHGASHPEFSVIDQCKQTNPTDKVALQSSNNG